MDAPRRWIRLARESRCRLTLFRRSATIPPAASPQDARLSLFGRVLALPRFLLAPLLTLPLLVLASPPGLSAQSTRLLREPTVSATQVAFSYGGDIWIVGREGGLARRLTSEPGFASSPHFSPDGEQVAYSAEHEGNTDVYVIPAEGGEPRRLTWHPEPDHARGWSPDGSRVLFSSQRTSAPRPHGGSPKFWGVPASGGLPEPLPMPRTHQGMFSPDGGRFAYQPHAPMDVEWRNYRGGVVRPIWVVDMDDYELETLPWDGSHDSDPVWVDRTIYFLSDRDWATNLWAFDTETADLRQVTHYAEFDVKNVNAGGGVVVYERAGYVYLFDPASGSDQQLEIEVRGDFPNAQPHWVDVTSRIRSASLSPTGERALFEARGEIFTVPTEEGDWRNLTQSSGSREGSPAWSPDGQRIAWFSDASGEYQLMVADQGGLAEPRAIPLSDPSFFFGLSWSPDSRTLAFQDADRHFYLVDVESGSVRVADQDLSSYPGPSIDPAWSPDSRWIAYTKRLDSEFKAVFLHSVETGTTHQITDGLADALSPVWDASGRYLWFLASTNYALNSQWLDMSGYDRPLERGLYLTVLRADDPSPLLPRSDEEGGGEDPGRGGASGGGAALAGGAVSGGPATGPQSSEDEVQVRIDLDGIERRVLPVDIPLREYASLDAGSEGVVFYGESVPNQPGFTLHRYDLAERESSPFLSPVQTVTLSADRKKLLYRSGSTWGVVGTSGPAQVGDGRLNVSLRAHVNPMEEWQQIFRDAWRLERDGFYAPNLHGADWDHVWGMYRPWVDHVRHRSDLTYVLDILGGELSVGHSFAGDPPSPAPDAVVPVGLLGADLEEAGGRYRIRTIYTGESWNPELQAPLDAPGMEVQEGDYILEVNGRNLAAPENPYRFFQGTAGRQTKLRINDRPTLEGSRMVTVVPVENEYQLRLRRWVEDNRRKVDEMSGGKLAYVYVPNTARAGYTYFNRYYFSQQDKPGVIIDERDNGGGSAADYMVQIMDRKLVGFFSNRTDRDRPSVSPGAGIWGPKVMIINSLAGSGGDMLPYMFRKLGLGPLVGTRTWGGLVATGGRELVDGGSITAPRPAFFDTDGEWAVENEGVAPDIEVELTPAEVIAGRDPQLERAVQEGLRLLEGYVSPIQPAPPYPVRVRRPQRSGDG